MVILLHFQFIVLRAYFVLISSKFVFYSALASCKGGSIFNLLLFQSHHAARHKRGMAAKKGTF